MRFIDRQLIAQHLFTDKNLVWGVAWTITRVISERVLKAALFDFIIRCNHFSLPKEKNLICY